KDDLRFFKEKTQGQICVFGRKTFESIIEMNGKPLPNRINVVLTRDDSYTPRHGEFVFHSVEQILRHHATMTEGDKKVMICGGSEVYRAFLPYASTIHLTHVNKHVEDAEVFYPLDLQDLCNFTPVEEEEHYSEEYDCFYKFVTYKKGVNQGDKNQEQHPR